MERARVKRYTTWGEVGQMRLSGLAVKTAPDSVVAGSEAPQWVQTGSDKAVSAYVASQQIQRRLEQENPIPDRAVAGQTAP